MLEPVEMVRVWVSLPEELLLENAAFEMLLDMLCVRRPSCVGGTLRLLPNVAPILCGELESIGGGEDDSGPDDLGEGGA